MSRPVRFEAEAAAELDEASRWYERRKRGLGTEFLEVIHAALRQVVRWPQAGAPVVGVSRDLPVRQVPAGRFPYRVVYLETPSTVRVLAIAHERREPGYWHGRTRN